MIKGTVKWYNKTKGYGFAEGDGKDYFIHIKEMKNVGDEGLKEGDKIEFTPGETPKGLKAENIFWVK